jgi:hypothetical protein
VDVPVLVVLLASSLLTPTSFVFSRIRARIRARRNDTRSLPLGSLPRDRVIRNQVRVPPMAEYEYEKAGIDKNFSQVADISRSILRLLQLRIEHDDQSWIGF